MIAPTKLIAAPKMARTAKPMFDPMAFALAAGRPQRVERVEPRTRKDRPDRAIGQPARKAGNDPKRERSQRVAVIVAADGRPGPAAGVVGLHGAQK